MAKVRFVFRDFRGRVLVSGRFWAGMLVFFFVNFVCFREMVPGLQAMGYTVNLFEMVGAYMSSTVPMILFYAALVFQVGAFPEWDGTQNAILRLGKRCWLFGQFLHAVLVFLIQYAVLVAAVWASLRPCLTYDNRWSGFMRAACSDILVVIQTGLNNTVDFDAALMEAGSPLVVFGISFLLNLLCSLLFGSLLIVLNISRPGGTGTMAVLLLVSGRFLTSYVSWVVAQSFGGGGLLADIVDTVCFGLMPMVQNTLTGMGMAVNGITGSLTPAARLAYAVCYFAVLVAAVWAWGCRKVKEVDLT